MKGILAFRESRRPLTWALRLQVRRTIQKKVPCADRIAYRKRLAAVKSGLRNKVPHLAADSDHDDAWMTSSAIKFREWCKHLSWTMHIECSRLQKVVLQLQHPRDGRLSNVPDIVGQVLDTNHRSHNKNCLRQCLKL